MTDPSSETQHAQEPPPPPRPGPVPPTRTQVYDAAAYVTALAYHHRAQLSQSSLPLVHPDLHWLLLAHTAPAFELAGIRSTPATEIAVLRLVFAALRKATAVRTAEFGGYLESITPGQQQHILALAHRYLSDQ
ncbi:hypothetical protein [Actinospica robiniae]|uniref:hypothetical protein n=1 Tax=Actinospica robiniae TaxID=304901 RepID=UPI000427A2DB|nr:hypothetical protein [Actinospica robiniae]